MGEMSQVALSQTCYLVCPLPLARLVRLGDLGVYNLDL
jgi:hypothetical protein